MIEINIQNSSMQTKGSGLACFDCKAIKIVKSEFKNVRSTKGGAIFIQETEVSKKDSD
jgi:hypothetical protein